MRALPLFHRIAETRVVVVGEGPAGAAKRRLVERAGGVACGEHEAHHARLAFIALDDAAEAATCALRLRRRGLLVNVTDRPELCDFTVPSLLERGPLVVAVGTAGASAGLAKQVRLALERVLPASIGALAETLEGARGSLRARWPEPRARREALDAALAPGGPLDPLAESAADRVAGWLAAPDAAPGGSTVTITLTSDDPDDLTLRQARWLGTAERVAHPPDIAAAILARARADAERIVMQTAAPLPDGSGLTVILTRG